MRRHRLVVGLLYRVDKYVTKLFLGKYFDTLCKYLIFGSSIVYLYEFHYLIELRMI